MYGTPGIGHLILAPFVGYLVVDAVSGVIVYFKYSLKASLLFLVNMLPT